MNTTRILLALLVAVAAPPAAGAAPLQVAATVPELGSLARTVGGDDVAVTVFAKPTEDPHFVEPRPSFVRTLSRADAYVETGLDQESGWASSVLRKARNPKILPGAPGFIDASTVIEPLAVPTAPVDRSMGDVHPLGNPHYLLDPLNGLRVAELLATRFGGLQPDREDEFRRRYEAFRTRLGRALVGEALADRYDFVKLARLHEHGKLRSFLEERGHLDSLGGWIGATLPHEGVAVVTDHDMWPYFSRRFGIRIVGSLEPKPGIPPTTGHLRELLGTMRAKGSRAILASAYYDPRHAEFVAQHTGAAIARMAHQAGARPGTDDYLAMVAHNVRELVSKLEKGRE